MNFRSQMMVGCAGWMLSATPLLALTPAPVENPYEPIVTRNMFGLVPIPPVDPASLVPATPVPKITPNGIMTIFGKVQVLFKVQATPQAGQPAKEQSYTMCEGDRQDEITVQKIDEQAASITFDNHGTIQTLELSKTVTPSGGPAPTTGGGPRVPGTMPSAVPTAGGGSPAAGIGFGGRFGRNRGAAANASPAVANPQAYGSAGTVGTATDNEAPVDQSPEARVIMMEAQRAKWLQEGNPAAAIIPTTAITKQVTGEEDASTIPALPGE